MAENKVEMVFALEDSKDYFAIPYPNDLRRDPDGRVNRAKFPVPWYHPLALYYRKISHKMDGFSISESAFLRFTGKIAATLPGPEDSIKPASPIFLVNIDRASPGFGEHIPVFCYFHTHKSGPLQNLLAVCPYPGFVLREKTRHAVVVMRGLDPNLVQSKVLEDLLAGKNPGGSFGARAVEIFEPLLQFLKEKNISANEIAAATVYTTGEPTRPLQQIMKFVESHPVLKIDEPLTLYAEHPGFYALQSSYIAPQFQTGTGSQLVTGGKILFDKDNLPIVQRQEKIPIKVVVPKGKMPAKGFPCVIYLHGGGNTSIEYLDHHILSQDNQFQPGAGPARTFAGMGIGGVGMGLVKNPERYGKMGKSGRTAEIPFYNFWRGEVLVTNHWQCVSDCAFLLRLMRELVVDPALCPKTDASASPDGKIRFDPRFFFAMGFSLGGTVLGSWAGVEPGIIATIPCGASGHWGMLIRNFTAVPNKPFFFAWLTGGRPSEEMDSRWPVMSLLQAVLEPCDTITFGPLVYKRPLAGAPAKNIYLAVGQNDFYTKAFTQNAVATSLFLPLAGKVVEPSILLNQKLLGFDKPLDFPVSQNVQSEDGRKVTAAVLQYEADSWTHEGHNVNHNLPETKYQHGWFLRTLIDSGVAIIPEPLPEGSPLKTK